MKTIVLVDQNKDDLQFMKEAIAAISPEYRCLSFVFPEEAVHAMINDIVRKPDIVVMNLNLRGKNGIQWLTKLRMEPKFDDMPVVLFAPKITPNIVSALEDLGVTYTFEKPSTIRGWKTAMGEMFVSIPSENIDMDVLFSYSKHSAYSNLT
jgi:response regulator RpfG family c-di-GMP phosphodiesterase